LKVYDNEGAEILILSLEMENIAITLSKHLVVIWKFLKYWNNIVTMAVKTQLTIMIQFFNIEMITVNCSASQRLVKFILFKIIVCEFGT